MNKQAIVKFLAEQMEWKTLDDWTENEFVSNDSGAIFVDEPNNIAHLDFRPMHKIEHAWMVVEWMRSNDPMGALIKFVDIYAPEHDADQNAWPADVYNVFATLTPQNICITAARALATDEQCKEWGL